MDDGTASELCPMAVESLDSAGAILVDSLKV